MLWVLTDLSTCKSYMVYSLALPIHLQEGGHTAVKCHSVLLWHSGVSSQKKIVKMRWTLTFIIIIIVRISVECLLCAYALC